MDCHFLFQRIFPTQGSKTGLLHCRQILYDLSYGNFSYYPPKEHNGGKLSKGRLRELRESKWRIQVKARSTGAVSQAPPRKAFCLPSLPTRRQEKNKSISDKQSLEMELKLQKTGKGIVNENCVWEVKPEGGKVQREGREHSSTWPLLPLADLRGWGWGGGVGCQSESNISSHRGFLVS